MNRSNRGIRTAVRAAVAWLALAPVFASAAVDVPAVSGKLAVGGEFRTRGESWNWFDAASGANDDYVFGATRLRLFGEWKDELFDVRIEGQSTALFSLPDDAAGPGPEGALGLGPVYRANNDGETTDVGVFLHQAYVQLKDLGNTGLGIRAGRFPFSEGSEALTGDATLDWLKKIRLSQRLIGPFDWSHVGRRFDGALVTWSAKPHQLTALWAKPTEGGFHLDAMEHIGDIDLAYASWTVSKPAFLENGDVRVFFIHYDDRRGLVPTDNRPAEVRAADRGDITIESFGGHAIYALPTAAGTVDALAWGLVQTGDWGALSHSAHAFDFEVGFQPAGLFAKPWIRAGYGRSSGDDDPADGDHDTFFQILPTARLYSWSVFYNLMNNEDAFLMLVLRPAAGLVSRTDFHMIRLNSGNDLWYQGAGATIADEQPGFGFVGRPTMGDRDLLRVVETQLTYTLNAYVELELYYGHVFGGDVVRNVFTGDDADFAYAQLTLTF